jgi:Zn finger protein HypA/HybF involved in hydrogenase expression
VRDAQFCTCSYFADKIGMHDFLLAKEIIEEVAKIAKEKRLSSVKKVSLEIGIIALAHDGLPEHPEDINLVNLEFGLKSIAPKYGLEKAKFDVKRIPGDNWRITDIETE